MIETLAMMLLDSGASSARTDAVRIRVVPLSELAHSTEGPTRGYAHIGGDRIPKGVPGRLELGPLRMFAVGEVYPGEGFPMHAHDNVENLLFTRQGLFEHADSLGNKRLLGPSDVYLMSAGSGMEHSERVRGDEPHRGAVIWLDPAQRDTPPRLEIASAPIEQRRNRWAVLASGRPERPAGVPVIGQDASVSAAVVGAGRTVSYLLERGRAAYLAPFDGAVEVNGHRAEAGERVIATGSGELAVTALEPSEVLLVDLPAAGEPGRRARVSP